MCLCLAAEWQVLPLSPYQLMDIMWVADGCWGSINAVLSYFWFHNPRNMIKSHSMLSDCKMLPPLRQSPKWVRLSSGTKVISFNHLFSQMLVSLMEFTNTLGKARDWGLRLLLCRFILQTLLARNTIAGKFLVLQRDSMAKYPRWWKRFSWQPFFGYSFVLSNSILSAY